MRCLVSLLAMLLVVIPAPVDGQDAAVEDNASRSRASWDTETLDCIARWPLQHGGRVKPFGTFAGFTMLKINGKRSVTIDGDKLGPTAWALDCMLYPEIARTYPCILVSNAEVLTSVGLDVSGRKRSSRWSYDQLAPVLDEIFSSASRIKNSKDSKTWSVVERQTVQLAQNLGSLEELLYGFDSARNQLPLFTAPEFQEVFGVEPRPGFSPLIAGVDRLANLTDPEKLRELPEERQTEVIAVLDDLRSQLVVQLQIARRGLAWFAPEQVQTGKDAPPPIWSRTDGILESALTMNTQPRQSEALQTIEEMVALRDDRPAFKEKAIQVQTKLMALASSHGQGQYVSLETTFYRWDFFFKALICFMLAFVISCLGWMKPDSPLSSRGSWTFSLLGLILLVVGVTIRCVIQGRPPVTTLYETILFITACCVLTALFIERLDRRQIALTMATVLGSIGCFLSIKYEMKEAVTAGDTMPSLMAALDTNFWLSTHVTSVTLGYSAGLLAAAISHVWLLGKLTGFRKGDGDFYRSITRMVYGTICFGLFFSIVGTILGGIWANYSWGRFWGWDPKENGALMICLAELVILHARMGGFIRDQGLHILVLINAIIVAFSWWGVNLLGVGLHSYGFTDGIQSILYIFYALETVIIVMSLLHRYFSKDSYTRPSGQSPTAA